jgi:hypothetical protein
MNEGVLKRSLASLLINISAGLILTLMATHDLMILFANSFFALITFKLSVDLESNIKSYVRPHRKFK